MAWGNASCLAKTVPLETVSQNHCTSQDKKYQVFMYIFTFQKRARRLSVGNLNTLAAPHRLLLV